MWPTVHLWWCSSLEKSLSEYVSKRREEFLVWVKAFSQNVSLRSSPNMALLLGLDTSTGVRTAFRVGIQKKEKKKYMENNKSIYIYEYYGILFSSIASVANLGLSLCPASCKILQARGTPTRTECWVAWKDLREWNMKPLHHLLKEAQWYMNIHIYIYIYTCIYIYI